MQQQPGAASASPAVASQLNQSTPCPSLPTSRTNTPDTVVSVMTGFPSFRAEELEKWNMTAAECSGCLTVVPHNQLFVCVKKECEYRMKQQVSICTPTQFFNVEKVFCGRCSFRGCHSPHMKFLRSAEKLAIQTASREIGPPLQEFFEKVAFINNEEPVDYIMSSEFNTLELPLIPIVDYLSASDNTAEWIQKKRTLEQVGASVQECRRIGHEYVKKMAKKALDAYNELNDEIERELRVIKPEMEEMIQMRTEEHQKRMHLSPRISESKTEVSSSSRKSSSSRSTMSRCSSVSSVMTEDTASTSSTATVTVPPVIPKQEPVESPKQDGSLVRMLCSKLTHRFDMVRDEITLEEALQDVSNTLHQATGTDEDKLAAALMFKEKTTFALYYPPPSKS